MTGTEKQIKWAEDIKREFMAQVRRAYIPNWNPDLNDYEESETKTVILAALDFIDKKYTDAKFWIESDTSKNLEMFCEMTKDPEMQALFA